MKAICAGQCTKDDVVKRNLEQYRAVYMRTQAQVHKLKEVSFRMALYDCLTLDFHTKTFMQAVNKYIPGAHSNRGAFQ